MNKIPTINLDNNSFKLSDDLIKKTQFIGMRNFTLSKNPIATNGIGPCLGIGISYEGINYLEHAIPTDFVNKNGESIKRMEEVIKQFIQYKIIPFVYLFKATASNDDLKYIFNKLKELGIIEKNRLILCDCTYFFTHMR